MCTAVPCGSSAGATATLACNYPFHPAGQGVTKVCRRTGNSLQWEPLATATCVTTEAEAEAEACPPLAPVAHATIAYDTGALTTTTRSATVSCDESTYKMSGPYLADQETIFCVHGQPPHWDRPTHDCVEYHAPLCEPLHTVTGGDWIYANETIERPLNYLLTSGKYSRNVSRTEGSTAILQCRNGLVSNNPTAPPRVCHRGGWSLAYPPPQCQTPVG